MTLLPAAVWHEGLQQQGASESVQRVFGPLRMEGPHLLLPSSSQLCMESGRDFVIKKSQWQGAERLWFPASNHNI